MDFTLKSTLGALRSGWYLILIGVMVASGAAVAIDSGATPVYEASASYIVSPGSQVAPDDVAQGVNTLDSSRSRSIMTTLTEIADSDAVLSEAFTLLGLAPELTELYSVESVVVPEANVMETIVTGPDPETAAQLASTVGSLGGSRFVALYQIYGVEVLDAATVPTEPANPGLSQSLVIAIALGIMAGGAAALLRFAFSQRSRRTMDRRLGAYHASEVTPIDRHGRFKRTG
jgi:receptor protein-tyrosine kinase